MRHSAFRVVAAVGFWLGVIAAGETADWPPHARLNAARQAGPPCTAGDCEIVLTKIISLTDKGHPGTILDQSPHVVQDREGRFYHATAQAQIAVFDKTGQISTLIGKPGELGRIATLFAGPQGKVLAYNFMAKELREVIVGGARGAALGPGSRMDYPPALILDNGSIVVAQQIRTPELMGFPLHLFAADGGLVRSFGADVPEYRADLRLLMDRVVTPSADGSLWTIQRGRYVLERWNVATGTLIARLPFRHRGSKSPRPTRATTRRGRRP